MIKKEQLVKKYYVKNKNLINEIKKWQETDIVSDELGKMFFTISQNLAKKSNWAGYTPEWKEDMIQEAALVCIKYGKNFDHAKSKNPFAYITTICYNAFRMYVNKQKRHSIIKDICFNNKEDYLLKRGESINSCIDYTKFLKE